MIDREKTLKTVLITGASSGIGFETSKHYYLSGWHVIMVAKNQTALRLAAESILKDSQPNKLEQYAVDLSLIQARVQFVKELLQAHSTIDILINNAGAIFPEFALNGEGFERTIALNYFGSAHLSLLLIPTLLNSDKGMIINLSSDLFNIGKLNFSSFHQDTYHQKDSSATKISLRQRILYLLLGKFQLEAYAQSKLAIMLFTKILAEKHAQTPLKIYSFHPKMVNTNITKNGKGLVYSLVWPLLNFFFAAHPQKSAKALYKLSQKNLPSGSYIVMDKTEETKHLKTHSEQARKLWETTLNTLNLSYKVD